MLLCLAKATARGRSLSTPRFRPTPAYRCPIQTLAFRAARSRTPRRPHTQANPRRDRRRRQDPRPPDYLKPILKTTLDGAAPPNDGEPRAHGPLLASACLSAARLRNVQIPQRFTGVCGAHSGAGPVDLDVVARVGQCTDHGD